MADTCTVSCNGFIPERKNEDLEDLPNPFVTAQKKKYKVQNVFKSKIHKKDDLLIILAFILFLLFTKLLFY